MKLELKPCPFCNSEQLHFSRMRRSEPQMVVCDNCDANGPMCETKVEAARRWNIRTGEK